MRSTRTWIAVGAVVLLLAAVLVALPEVLRRVAVAKMEATTGRAAAIEDVDFNPFTGRLAITQLRLAAAEGPEPFLAFERFDGRLRWWKLVQGRLHLDEARLVAPIVHLTRLGPGAFDLPIPPPSDRPDPAAAPPPTEGRRLGLTLKRFNVEGGSIVLTDRTPASPLEWRVEALAVQGEHLSTVDEGDGGTVTIAFQIDDNPVSLKVERLRLVPTTASITLALQGFDLTALVPYLPQEGPLALKSGRLNAKLTVDYGSPTDLHVDGELEVDELVLLREGHDEPVFSASAVTITANDLKRSPSGFHAGAVHVEAAPTVIDDTVRPPVRLSLSSLRLGLEDADWPMRAPARIRVEADVRPKGHLKTDGSLTLAPLAADLHVIATDIDVAPYRPYLKLTQPLHGHVSADLQIAAAKAGDLSVKVRGRTDLRHIALGHSDQPIVTLPRAELSGLAIDWPTRIEIGRIHLRKPAVVVERDEHGRFTLRDVLRRDGTRTAASSPDGKPVAANGQKPSTTELHKAIGRLVIEDGSVRFVDRTTDPDYVEEITRLHVRVERIASSGPPGRIVVQGLVHGSSAVDLQGAVNPFGKELYVDLAGRLDNFAIPTTNPYVNRILAWVARDGSLSNEVHYRIRGDRLEATNEIEIEDLRVVKAGDKDEVRQRLGVPLGLAVDLMKDPSGKIKLSLPVSGSLSEPQFSFADAIWNAARNAIVNILSAPFKMIGRLFTGERNEITEMRIDPVRFETGTSVLEPEMDAHLKDIAGFLRRSPFIRVSLSAILTVSDIADLKAQQVGAAIQQLQRERAIQDFAKAAKALFEQRLPGRPVPESVSAIVLTLREQEAQPEEDLHALAARRLRIVQDRLTKEGGVDAARLDLQDGQRVQEEDRAGRVEFALQS